MTWFLIIQMLGALSAYGTAGPTAPSQVGPFKSQAACEAAGNQIKKAFSNLRFVCVPDDVPPGG